MLSTGPKSLPHELDFLVWTGLLSDFAERSSYIVRPEEVDMFRAVNERNILIRPKKITFCQKNFGVLVKNVFCSFTGFQGVRDRAGGGGHRQRGGREVGGGGPGTNCIKIGLPGRQEPNSIEKKND